MTLRLRALGIGPRAGLPVFGKNDPAQSGKSHLRYATGYGLTAKDVGWFWRPYLGNRIADPPQDATAMRADLEGLPPLFVAAAKCDPIRDDNYMLAERLTGQRVPHVFRLWHGMIHGCVGMGRELNHTDAPLAGAAVLLAHVM